jgi:hypothetical protein
MRRNNIIIALVIHIGSTITVLGQTTFQDYLGKEKSYALDQLIQLFDNEISSHIKDDYDTNMVIKDFVELSEVCAPYFLNDFLQVDSIKAKHILQLIESSGLRQEIWLYDTLEYSGNETIAYYHKIQDSLRKTDKFNILFDLGNVVDSFPEFLDFPFDTIPVITFDTTRLISRYSKIVEALHKCCSENELINDYCETKIMSDEVSPTILAVSILDYAKDIELNDYQVKVILVTEFYYHFLYNSIFNKTAPNNR